MLAFAEKTLAHPDNRHLAGRVSLVAADVALTGKARAAAGLADGAFDFAIMNPPFNAGHDRATPDALKRDAHVMPDGLFERWIRSAAAIVRPRGGLAVIARPQSLAPILAALAGRFGKVEILPVHPRAGRARRSASSCARCAPRGPAVAAAAACRCMKPTATASRRGPTPSTTARLRCSAIERLAALRAIAQRRECLHASRRRTGDRHL